MNQAQAILALDDAEARLRTAFDEAQAKFEAIRAFLVAGAAEQPTTTPSGPAPAPAATARLSAPAAFFDHVRGKLWPKLTPEIVAGCERLMRVGGGVLPIGWMADVLGQVYHETAYTMAPIKERGSWAYLDKYDTGPLAERLGNTPEDDDDGQKYAGRGDIQITGLRNYRNATRKLRELGVLKDGEDLEKNPDLALRPDISAAIAVYGMRDGWFTGKRLNDYINAAPTLQQFVNARRIVNGTDRADEIAGYAMTFLEALKAGGWR